MNHDIDSKALSKTSAIDESQIVTTHFHKCPVEFNINHHDYVICLVMCICLRSIEIFSEAIYFQDLQYKLKIPPADSLWLHQPPESRGLSRSEFAYAASFSLSILSTCKLQDFALL